MKLKNKLIPLAVVATAAAAVVPLTVSCSNSEVSVSEINNVDAALPGFLPYQKNPGFLEYDESKYTEEEFATQEYTAFVKQNPQAFVDDLRWGVYQNWLSFYENSNFKQTFTPDALGAQTVTALEFNSDLKSLKFGATTPTFSTTEIVYPGQGQKAKHTANTVSFKMHVEIEAEVRTYRTNIGSFGSLNGTAKSVKTIKASTDVEYKNMIFFAYPAARDSKLDLAYWANATATGSGEYKTTSLTPNKEVDTDAPGWFITISSLQSSQDQYKYDFDDWGINYDSNIEIVESVKNRIDATIKNQINVIADELFRELNFTSEEKLVEEIEND